MEKEVIPKANTPIKTPVTKSVKEVVPKTNIPIKAPVTKSVKEVTQRANTPIKIPEYKAIGKGSIGQSVKEGVPKYLIPTKRLATILGGVFFAVIALALIQLPYDEILKGNFEISVGFPMHFLVFEIEATGDELPLKPIGLIVDLLLYLILSYIIDVIISLMIIAVTVRKRKEEGTAPKVYKPKKPTLAEKAVEKVILKKDALQPKVPNAVHPFPE